MWSIKITSSSFLFLLVFVNSSVCQTPDPDCDGCCSAYHEIDDPRRSTMSVWRPGEPVLCDRWLKWGWYRFTSFAGGKMPETIVPENHCGTHAPIWLRGSHPTREEGNVVREACINTFGWNDGCWESFDMNITNCGNYFVYYLRPPYYCAVAYCAGKRY